jgi:dienelactone hydrolase
MAHPPPAAHPLPDLLRRDDGSRIGSAAHWQIHAAEKGRQLLQLGYGGMPPRPDRTQAEPLHAIEVARLGGARLSNWRVQSLGPACSFTMQLLLPADAAKSPVILSGDGCWRYTTDEVVDELLRRGYALAQFNRVEIVADLMPPPPDWRDAGLFAKLPGAHFGAIAAWAWGYQRCVDVLAAMAEIDAAAIAVSGHSRGGKAALLAGATDERIALTHANNSGTGGSASYRDPGAGGESLAQLVAAFPHWMGPELGAFAGRENELPFDQHLLKAMLAPRALLTTDASDDAWANPSGCLHTHQAARQVFRLLGAGERCGIVMREGGHPMRIDDWRALLDFADWQLRGLPRTRVFEP